jgi:hypothetical protein
MKDAATVNAKTVSKSGEVDWLNLPTKLKILQVYQKRSYSSIYLRIEATAAGHRAVSFPKTILEKLNCKLHIVR